MGKLKTASLVLTALIAVATYKIGSTIFGDGELPEPLPDTFWGPKELEKQVQDTAMHYFNIKLPEPELVSFYRKLKEELESGRFTPPLENIGFEYGFNSDYLKTVLEYWLYKYDWRARETKLNKYPQYKVKISGLDIHFQLIKSASSGIGKYKTRPLLLLHGWPGSFVEFQKVIPKLLDPRNSEYNFDLIVPSLPGYGFSDAAAKPGLGPAQVGQIMQKLMKRLGYEKFYVQGGDWGAIIGDYMAKMYPDNVVALHSNMCQSQHPSTMAKTLLASFFPSFFFDAEEQEQILQPVEFWPYIIRETGYAHIQSTKPDTVGAALLHSPTGLAAYILEKFSTWTNAKAGYSKQDGALTNKFKLDELLDNIMVYWMSKSVVTSMRLYSEAFSPVHFELQRVPVKVPTACVVPRHESFIGHSKSMLKDTYRNLMRYTLAKDGGHFYAMEHPEELATDVIPFVKQVEETYKPFGNQADSKINAEEEDDDEDFE